MEKPALDVEEVQMNLACEQGAALDNLLRDISTECDLQNDVNLELQRQEAFLRQLLESEERKSEARAAMQLELDKVHRIMRELENMEPQQVPVDETEKFPENNS